MCSTAELRRPRPEPQRAALALALVLRFLARCLASATRFRLFSGGQPLSWNWAITRRTAAMSWVKALRVGFELRTFGS